MRIDHVYLGLRVVVENGVDMEDYGGNLDSRVDYNWLGIYQPMKAEEAGLETPSLNLAVFLTTTAVWGEEKKSEKYPS